MNNQSLTPIQKDLLKMFAYDHSDKFANEIKCVLSNYFLSKIDAETDRLWMEGKLDQSVLNEIRKEDLHSKRTSAYGRIGS